MRSLVRSAALLSAVTSGLLLAACGGSPATSNGGAPASSTTPALIHTQSITVANKTQTVLKNNRGLTLYYFTADTASSIACSAGCASNWPPLLATDGTPTSSPSLPGRLTVMDGSNGKQVVYNGHPLYTFFKDADSGDAYGQGIGGKWFVATPDLAAAAAASASASASRSAYTPTY